MFITIALNSGQRVILTTTNKMGFEQLDRAVCHICKGEPKTSWSHVHYVLPLYHRTTHTQSTGWMSTRGLSTRYTIMMTGRLGTSLITSSQPLMLLLAVFVYDLLTWIVSLFLAADLARTAVGLFITSWPDSL